MSPRESALTCVTFPREEPGAAVTKSESLAGHCLVLRNKLTDLALHDLLLLLVGNLVTRLFYRGLVSPGLYLRISDERMQCLGYRPKNFT